jgi:hypothetical protein
VTRAAPSGRSRGIEQRPPGPCTPLCRICPGGIKRARLRFHATEGRPSSVRPITPDGKRFPCRGRASSSGPSRSTIVSARSSRSGSRSRRPLGPRRARAACTGGLADAVWRGNSDRSAGTLNRAGPRGLGPVPVEPRFWFGRVGKGVRKRQHPPGVRPWQTPPSGPHSEAMVRTLIAIGKSADHRRVRTKPGGT